MTVTAEDVEAWASELEESYASWPEGSAVREDAYKSAAMLRTLLQERDDAKAEAYESAMKWCRVAAENCRQQAEGNGVPYARHRLVARAEAHESAADEFLLFAAQARQEGGE